MSAERNPLGEQSLLARPLIWATLVVLRYPVWTVGLALFFALAALTLAGLKLGYRSSRQDLLNPSSEFNRLWLEYLGEFGDEDDAVVVVSAASREQVVPLLDELSKELSRSGQPFHGVLGKLDLERIKAKGLYYLSPDELLRIEQFVAQVQPAVAGDWSRLGIAARLAELTDQLESTSGDAAAGEMAARELERSAQGLLAALADQPRYVSPWPEPPPELVRLTSSEGEHLLANEGRLGFILLRLDPNRESGHDNFVPRSQATMALRALIAQVSAGHPEAEIGLTGLPIMEHDEMLVSQSSMFWASLVSFIGVALLFVAGLGGLRHALLANLVLLVGMAWSFGYATLSVGHLNILSVVFTVTLIGIGIDYGIYYISRYMQVRAGGRGTRSALLATSRAVGPAIATGALTTAVAFFAAGFTEFTGVAELGIISGGGILLCALAELLVLPAAVLLLDKSRLGQKMPDPLPVRSWLAPFWRLPRLSLAAAAVSTALLALGMGRLWFDHNLLNLQAEGQESVALERKLLTESDQSCWFALSLADSPRELLERKARFEQLGSVARTEEIVSLLPLDGATKQARIQRIAERLEVLPKQPAMIPLAPPAELKRLVSHAEKSAAGVGWITDPPPSTQRAAEVLAQVRQTLAKLPLAESYSRQSHYQQHAASELLARLRMLAVMAAAEPPAWQDLPPSLVQRFVGRNGRHLLKVYGRGEVWETAALDRFVSEVRSVDPRATGHPLQAHEASRQMKRSYEQAAWYALVVIVVVLLADFRSLRYAAMAALPLGMGVLQVFGLMGHLGLPLNPANLIALPLILGIGVDYGVHIVHDYREQRGRYQMSRSTAVAVLVDGLTTLVGFGSLMIASHQGLQSLGRVLTIGVTACLVSSLVILPALLTWMSASRPATLSLTDQAATPPDTLELHPVQRRLAA